MSPPHVLFFLGLTLALISHEQFKASHRSTLLPSLYPSQHISTHLNPYQPISFHQKKKKKMLKSPFGDSSQPSFPTLTPLNPSQPISTHLNQSQPNSTHCNPSYPISTHLNQSERRRRKEKKTSKPLWQQRKKMYQGYYPLWLRDSLSPACGFLFT